VVGRKLAARVGGAFWVVRSPGGGARLTDLGFDVDEQPWSGGGGSASNSGSNNASSRSAFASALNRAMFSRPSFAIYASPGGSSPANARLSSSTLAWISSPRSEK